MWEYQKYKAILVNGVRNKCVFISFETYRNIAGSFSSFNFNLNGVI